MVTAPFVVDVFPPASVSVPLATLVVPAPTPVVLAPFSVSVPLATLTVPPVLVGAKEREPESGLGMSVVPGGLVVAEGELATKGAKGLANTRAADSTRGSPANPGRGAPGKLKVRPPPVIGVVVLRKVSEPVSTTTLSVEVVAPPPLMVSEPPNTDEPGYRPMISPSRVSFDQML